MRDLYEFEVWQEGMVVATTSAADEDTALREAMHYAMMYAQDGPAVEVRPATHDTGGGV